MARPAPKKLLVSSSPPNPPGVTAYSIEVTSTPRRVDIYLYGVIGPVAAEHPESVLAMVDAGTPIRPGLSGVSSWNARGMQPLDGLARSWCFAAHAGAFIAASSVPARRQLDLLNVNLPAFDSTGHDQSLARS